MTFWQSELNLSPPWGQYSVFCSNVHLMSFHLLRTGMSLELFCFCLFLVINNELDGLFFNSFIRMWCFCRFLCIVFHMYCEDRTYILCLFFRREKCASLLNCQLLGWYCERNLKIMSRLRTHVPTNYRLITLETRSKIDMCIETMFKETMFKGTMCKNLPPVEFILKPIGVWEPGLTC